MRERERKVQSAGRKYIDLMIDLLRGDKWFEWLRYLSIDGGGSGKE